MTPQLMAREAARRSKAAGIACRVLGANQIRRIGLNTLLAVSNRGGAREVTPDGEIVWRFFNRRLTDDKRRQVIIRMIRYAPETIEPLLAHSGGDGESPAVASGP